MKHHIRTKVPVLLISGVDESAQMAVGISLQFGLSDAVSVRHEIAPERQVLTRTVSDLTGVLERVEINLAHACVACAIREDIVPTLERLAARGRWGSIIATLPVGAEAGQVARVVEWQHRDLPHVQIAAVVTALDGATLTDDLLGSDLLVERGKHTSDDDRRGVAEVACAMVEYADVVCVPEGATTEERSLLSALARPRVPLVEDPCLLDATDLVAGRREHRAAEAWVADVRRGALPPLPSGGVWRLDLCSDRPIHPIRFREELPILGGGPRRSRGCFWLPTRPGLLCAWDGAGGQASIGPSDQTGHGEAALTRIIVMGLDDARAEHDEIAAAFARCLLTPEELRDRGPAWGESWDGLEPWLGPIHDVA